MQSYVVKKQDSYGSLKPAKFLQPNKTWGDLRSAKFFQYAGEAKDYKNKENQIVPITILLSERK